MPILYPPSSLSACVRIFRPPFPRTSEFFLKNQYQSIIIIFMNFCYLNFYWPNSLKWFIQWFIQICKLSSIIEHLLISINSLQYYNFLKFCGRRHLPLPPSPRPQASAFGKPPPPCVDVLYGWPLGKKFSFALILKISWKK